MFEVVATFRPDFEERLINRYATLQEARSVGQQVAVQHHDKIIRTRVRAVREAKTTTNDQA
jgi:hypothetical protein